MTGKELHEANSYHEHKNTERTQEDGIKTEHKLSIIK